MATESILDIRLLGGFAVRVGDRLVPPAVWRQRRAAAIVKLLALEPSRGLHREQLLDTLWPDFDPDSAANNLRGALHHARSGLERAGAPSAVFLIRDGDRVVLGPRNQIVVDVDTFAEAARRAWQSDDPALAAHTVALYTGDLLPEDLYEDWVATRRESLRASVLTLLTRLGELYERNGHLAQAIATRERIVQIDALDEAAHAGLMRLQARMGNRQVALEYYSRLATQLERELGTTPAPETQELAAAIREGRFTVVRTPSPPPTQAPPRAGGYPASARIPGAVDVLVGRERELAELDRLLTTARLVTLSGPGGIGKTRLATEAARAFRGHFPDGVAFVDLAPLRDPALVMPTVGHALGIDETTNRPFAESVAAAVGERRTLLVLDNLEQLTAAGRDLAALLADCPHLTVLTTSRTPLRLRGEHEYPVIPLAVPEPDAVRHGASLSEVAQVPAIELFARRAVASHPGFALSEQNITAVIDICRRLDGLPLAIEFAAAQVRALSTGQLLRRLERPLDALGTTAQDVPDRQRTLRDTIAWSHDLLAADEQVLFRRLAVFAGSWSLAGTEAVANIADDDDMDVVSTLGTLIDHSLVEARPGTDSAEMRYSMLETIREFAVEQLAASGEIVSTERAFEAFLIDYAEDAAAGLQGPDHLLWLDRLELEHDNFRAAIGRALDRDDGGTALRLALRLWPFWETRGYRREGRVWLERSLDHAAAADERDRADAEFALGRLWFDLGDYAAAETHYRKSLETRRRLGSPIAEAEALSALAMIAVNRLTYDEAHRLGEEALAISRQSNDRRGAATALRALGMIAREQGQYDRGLAYFEESMALGRALGDAAWVARITSQLGITHRLAGNVGQAQQFLDASRKLHTELGDRFALAVIANNQGHLAFDTDDLEHALTLYGEALVHFDAVGDAEGVVETIEWLGVVASARGDAVPALRLFGAMANAREELQLPPRLENDELRVATGIQPATRATGSLAATALAEGGTLRLAQARDEALALASTQKGPVGAEN